MVILIAIAALIGGMLNALLGWAKQVPPAPWDWRSFVTSFISAIIGAGGIAVAYNYSGITSTALAVLTSFLSGAGWTSGVSRVAGTIGAKVYAKLNKATLKN
jgi:hypothetical protein